MNIITRTHNQWISYPAKRIHNNIEQKGVSQNNFEQVLVPSYAYRSNFVPSLSFGKIQKIEKPKDFSNLDEFSAYFENKLQRQLYVKDREDIVNSIKHIAKETNVSKRFAKKVLARVTQFGSYSQMENFSKALHKYNYNGISYNDGDGVDTAQALRYVGHNKGLLKSTLVTDMLSEQFVTIVDNALLHDLSKVENRGKYFDFVKKETQGFKNFAIIDGWNIKIDGKDMSYTMLGATDSYEDISIAVINEMKKTGKTLDEVLNGDIIEQTKNMFGQNVNIDLIQNDKLRNPNINTILDNVNPKIPTKDEIKATIQLLSDIKTTNRDGVKDEKRAKNLEKDLAIYLDSLFSPFSTESLNKILKDKHSAIERQVERLGKTMEDVYYIIPTSYKSFSLVTYQYAKVNNVPSDKIIQYDHSELPPVDLEGKVGVILDDTLCSGDSLIRQEFKYLQGLDDRTLPKDFNLIFAPVMCLTTGKNIIETYIKSYHRKGIDFIIPSKVSDFQTTLEDHLDKVELRKELAPSLGGLGYGFVRSAIMFPFNIPDNNSDFATLFSSLFVGRVLDSKIYAKTGMNWSYPFTISEFNDMLNDKLKGKQRGEKL